MLFFEAIGLNWGGFLLWCGIALNETTTFNTFAVPSFFPHRRVLTRPGWLFKLLRATNSFHKWPYDRQFFGKQWCQQQRTEFFNFLHLSVHGLHRFVVKSSPNLISYQFKNSSTAFLAENISTNEKQFCYFERRQVLSCELEKLGNFLPNPTSLPLLKFVSYFRASNPREHFDGHSRFLFFQTANQEPFDSRAKTWLREEKRAKGTRMSAQRN